MTGLRSIEIGARVRTMLNVFTSCESCLYLEKLSVEYDSAGFDLRGELLVLTWNHNQWPFSEPNL